MPLNEGWYARNSGLNVGKTMGRIFEEHGRPDLHYIGHVESDIELRPDGLKEGVQGPIIRPYHPGGGTSYSKSYKPQKYVSALQGGEKPALVLMGHYHKQGYFVERNVHVVMAGCTSDQSIFMRKLQIPAEVGYWIAHLMVNQHDGTIQRAAMEWTGFYDQGFYTNWERF